MKKPILSFIVVALATGLWSQPSSHNPLRHASHDPSLVHNVQLPTDWNVNSWSVSSSIPFVDNSKVSAIAACADTAYVGGQEGNFVYKLALDKEGKLAYYGQSEPFGPESSGVKCIVVNGDYLYVCSRGNGYGLHFDYKVPDYLAPFEDSIGFSSVEKEGDVIAEITDDPCPSRWLKSLRVHKGEAMGHLTYSQKVPQASNDAEFIFWLKVRQSRAFRIPLIKDVLAVTIDNHGHMGLSAKQNDAMSQYVVHDEWLNVKLTAHDGRASLSVRGAECPDEWTDVCNTPISSFSYDSVCLGIEARGAVDVLLDDYAYCKSHIDDNCYINGQLTILDRRSLSVVNSYKLNLRCLSMYKDGNHLYLGMIGGINAYDICQPSQPRLVGTFRDPVHRYWSYPPKEKATYQYRVPGQEFQRMDMMQLPDGRKLLAGGSDTHGVTLVDVSDPTKPTLFSNLDTTPIVPIKENPNGQRAYIEWGVNCEYPYIYTTVATLHSLVHNEYYSGKHTPLSPTPITYGLKVYDLSDSSAVKDTLVLAPSEYRTTHLAKDGDSYPNLICRVGDTMFLNFGDQGIAAFRAAGFQSSFVGIIRMPAPGRIRYIAPFRNRLLAGDGAVSGPWTACNIYCLEQQPSVTQSEKQ